MQNRVPRNVLTSFTAQKNSDCRIVAFLALQIIIHTDIHINLPNILMGNCTHLQVNQNVTFQFNIVEYKVDIIVFRICNNVLLASHKSKSFAHFHQKVTNVGKDC